MYTPPPSTPVYQPTEEEPPKQGKRTYLIIGAVVLLVITVIVLFIFGRSRPRGVPGGQPGTPGAGAPMGTEISPAREATAEEREARGLPEGTKFKVIQTTEGPTEVFEFPPQPGLPGLVQ